MYPAILFFLSSCYLLLLSNKNQSFYLFQFHISMIYPKYLSQFHFSVVICLLCNVMLWNIYIYIHIFFYLLRYIIFLLAMYIMYIYEWKTYLMQFVVMKVYLVASFLLKVNDWVCVCYKSKHPCTIF